MRVITSELDLMTVSGGAITTTVDGDLGSNTGGNIAGCMAPGVGFSNPLDDGGIAAETVGVANEITTSSTTAPAAQAPAPAPSASCAALGGLAAIGAGAVAGGSCLFTPTPKPACAILAGVVGYAANLQVGLSCNASVPH